jgi:hypothetical protein
MIAISFIRSTRRSASATDRVTQCRSSIDAPLVFALREAWSAAAARQDVASSHSANVGLPGWRAGRAAGPPPHRGGPRRRGHARPQSAPGHRAGPPAISPSRPCFPPAARRSPGSVPRPIPVRAPSGGRWPGRLTVRFAAHRTHPMCIMSNSPACRCRTDRPSGRPWRHQQRAILRRHGTRSLPGHGHGPASPDARVSLSCAATLPAPHLHQYRGLAPCADVSAAPSGQMCLCFPHCGLATRHVLFLGGRACPPAQHDG